MSEQFLFFCTNLGNEQLLKEEIRVFYPELTLAYSRKRFLTFKNKGIQYDLNSISQLELTFATRSGICLGKSQPNNLLEALNKSCEQLKLELNSCTIHSFSLNTDFTLNGENIFNQDINNYSPINTTVIDVISLSENEIWFGIHTTNQNTTNYPNSNPRIELPALSPSRAYLKIAEATELFHLNIKDTDSWLDFGSSPGGASYFLLDKGCKVWGIDPAPTSDIIINNPNYTHISSPIQDLSQEKLPEEEIRWINADLNLNPKQTIKEVLRLCKKYNFSLKGIILTIPIIKMDHVKNIENFEEFFYDWGFTKIINRQIPSHKQEYVLIARR